MGNEKGHRNEEQTAKMVFHQLLDEPRDIQEILGHAASCQHPYQCWHEAEGTFPRLFLDMGDFYQDYDQKPENKMKKDDAQ